MRGYDEWVASISDVIPLQALLLVMFAVTVVVAVLWYTYPAWLKIPEPVVPRLRLPKWRWRWRLRVKRPRWNWRRLFSRRAIRRRPRKPRPVAIVKIDMPRDLTLADRLAAEGRYKEAIRQRLRDTVTDLAQAGIIEPQPGWTAAELSAVAAANRPPLGPALSGATDLFSQVWYGRRDAHADEDEQMRRLTGDVRSALGVPR